MRTAAKILAIFVAASLAGGTHAAPKRAHERDLRRRALTVDDANVSALPEIHVAKGVSTVLTFPVPLRDGGAFVADVKNVMDILSQSERVVLLAAVILLAPFGALPWGIAVLATLTTFTVGQRILSVHRQLAEREQHSKEHA